MKFNTFSRERWCIVNHLCALLFLIQEVKLEWRPEFYESRMLNWWWQLHGTSSHHPPWYPFISNTLQFMNVPLWVSFQGRTSQVRVWCEKQWKFYELHVDLLILNIRRELSSFWIQDFMQKKESIDCLFSQWNYLCVVFYCRYRISGASNVSFYFLIICAVYTEVEWIRRVLKVCKIYLQTHLN